MSKPLFIGSEIYRRSSYGAAHPLRVPRVSTVMDLSRALGWLDDDVYRISPRAKPAALHIWHDADYIQALMQAEIDQRVSDDVRTHYGLGTLSNPVFPEMFRRPATSAGGSLMAGELLRNGGTVFHPAGGTHHGMPDHTNGFCYLNDPVLAILSLRRNGAQRVAYIDIDAHHPDGVEHAFGDDPDCLMISVHEDGRWPRTGALGADRTRSLYNLPVPAGMNDIEMAQITRNMILPVVQSFAPNAIVLQCGADAVDEDPQSRLSLSNNAHFDVVRGLMGLSERLLVLGGGGYNPWSVGRLWTGVWGVLNGFDLPDILPDTAQAILRNLAFDGNSRGRNPPAHWFTTLRDAPRVGPIRDEVVQSVAHVLKSASL
ncbi:MAG: acetoin utilization protein AcuC [Ascidiaceihabitans sp.]|nr:acetoin utilization protein AcuC [Ascidiaceihabitans sp.]